MEVGLVGKYEEVVANTHFASSLKSGDVDVFSTPSLVAFAGIFLFLFLSCIIYIIMANI